MSCFCGKRNGPPQQRIPIRQESELVPLTKGEFSLIEENRTVQFDKEQFCIGKYAMLDDLATNEKASKDYQKGKAAFYKRVKKELKLAAKPEAKDLRELFRLDPVLFRDVVQSSEPPASLKWEVWQLLINDKRYFSISEANFQTLIAEKNEKVEDIVSKDVPRTFSGKAFFRSQVESVQVGREMLFKLCKAVGTYFRNIGYTQGFNFLAGFVLEVSGGGELESVNFLLNLLKNERFMAIGLFDDCFPLVYFLNFLFHAKLRQADAELASAIEESGLPDEVWLHKWFMSLFTGYFPTYLCSRVFDLLLSSDIFALVSFAVALACHYRSDFLRARSDFSAVVETLASLGERKELLSATASLVEQAKRMRMASEFITEQLQKFRQSGHHSLARFERYAHVFHNYLNGAASQSQVNITVFDFDQKNLLGDHQPPQQPALEALQPPPFNLGKKPRPEKLDLRGEHLSDSSPPLQQPLVRVEPLGPQLEVGMESLDDSKPMVGEIVHMRIKDHIFKKNVN